MTELVINKYYNFTLYTSPVLGVTYRNAKLIATLDYNTALKFANIEFLQKQIYPYLPPNTLSDHTKYIYYLFNHNDANVVIADTWIISSSIEETTAMTFNLKLNNITTTQLNIIKEQLRLMGISFDLI